MAQRGEPDDGAHEARKRFEAAVKAVLARKEAEGGAATGEEVDRIRQLLDERYAYELHKWENSRLVSFRYVPRPEWPTAEWEALQAKLLEPAPAPRGQLMALDAASVAALRREADEAAPQRRSKRGPERDPLPVPDVTEAVRLKVMENAKYEEIEEATGLSTRKVGYVIEALEHRPVPDLAWDGSLVLGPETRNTPDGLILPARS